MRAKHFLTLAVAVYLAFATSAARADQATDEATIRANAAKYVESYNRRDSKTMASMWSPEAVYIDDETGEKAVGHDAIARQLDYEFAGAEDAKLTIHVDSIDFVSPNVAVEKGTAEVSYGKRPAEKSEYTAVHVKRDGKWLLDRVTEAPQPNVPPDAVAAPCFFFAVRPAPISGRANSANSRILFGRALCYRHSRETAAHMLLCAGLPTRTRYDRRSPRP